MFAKNGIKASKSVCVYMVRSTGADAELLKAESDKLHIITKETIEALCDDDVKVLLRQKWIDGIIAGTIIDIK